MMQLPVVCTLTPATLATRKAQLLPGLVRRAEVIEDRPDGYRLRFSSLDDILQTIASVIAAERQCCRFLEFQITIEPDEGPIWLTLSGPRGTTEFLAALMEG